MTPLFVDLLVWWDARLALEETFERPISSERASMSTGQPMHSQAKSRAIQDTLGIPSEALKTSGMGFFLLFFPATKARPASDLSIVHILR